MTVDTNIRFGDGSAYDRMMGVWSRLVGEVFLDWLSIPPHQRWIDIGCGNGAFTELLIERSSPEEVLGIDPSPGLLDFARARLAGRNARFELGHAMALPEPDAVFDIAAMALVLFFIPDPARGVSEMRRVVRPGGIVSAYVWDILNPGGFPMAALQRELSRRGISTMLPPRADISSIAALRSLWTDAGLVEVATQEITVVRTFADFEDYWESANIAIGMTSREREPNHKEKASIKDCLQASLPAEPTGEVRIRARANAVVGKTPRD